jgi:hypothetical protein
MKIPLRVPVLALSLIFVGCGGGANSDAQEEPVEDKETVFDPLIGSIDKANAVEDQVLQGKDRLDQAIDEAEGGSDESEDDRDD